jgi:hypothetical protein
LAVAGRPRVFNCYRRRRRHMHDTAQWISAIAAIIAAGFWLRSALLHIPPTLDMTLAGPKSPAGYMKRQSLWSAIAAVFAAVSATAQALSILSG